MVDKSPEFFFKIISSAEDIDSKARELALDLCDSFPVLELLKQPLPYNFEFIHFVANNAGQNIKRIEKYYKIKGKPKDFNQWKDKYIKKLQAEYQDWKEIKNLVFSYFVVTNS